MERQRFLALMRHELGIYVHIPFCARKCGYCDFLSFPAGRKKQRDYFAALNNEVRSFQGTDEYEAVSVYFGGGTPSLPEADLVCGTLDLIRSKFSVRDDAEITIECNPGTLTFEKLEAYRAAGFNRLSLGLQSADNDMLKKLGRIHTWEKFEEEYRQAREAGFTNISVDLMYGLPGQTCESWRDTLGKVLDLPDSYLTDAFSPGTGDHRAGTHSRGPEHISAYSLIIEEGTPFWELYHEDSEARAQGGRTLFLPSEDEEDQMLSDLKEYLGRAGMRRYEISNWSYPGCESRHNTGYWLRREYAGFGLGASGQIRDMRLRNTDDFSEYLEEYLTCAVESEPGGRTEGYERHHHGCEGDKDLRHIIYLSEKDEIEETMFLGLRRMEGVDLKKFTEAFGTDAETLYGSVIDDLTRAKLLEITSDGHMRLTERGIDVSNLVMSQFLLD